MELAPALLLSRVAHRPARQTTAQSAIGHRKGRENAFTAQERRRRVRSAGPRHHEGSRQAIDGEEYVKPYAVIRKSDGAEFMLDPGFNCTVEIVADNDEGIDNGATFFEKFKYKKDSEGHWINNSNLKLGTLTEVVKPGYFEDDTIPELTAEDLEAFEMICRIKPKKNPTTGQVTGSTIVWEIMKPLPKRKTAAVAVADEGYVEGEDEPDPPAPF